MWVLIWAALLLSLTERTTCNKQPQTPPPKTASPWTITFSPAEITAEKGLCAVISCTFSHAENFNPTAAIWFKCPENGKCDQDENIIIHSETPSKAQEGYRKRVSLLETDLTKKNCSVIISNIRKNDSGEYQFRLLSAYTYSKKVKITVRALTQKPSVLTPPLTEGEPATLTCTAPVICSGTPPNITWTWRGTGDNNIELRDSTTIQKREDLTSVTTSHFSTLTFTPSAEHHKMMVTCQVTQKKFHIEETVTLNVTYHPVIPVILPGSGCVDQAEVMTCVCVSQGVPLPLIEWPLLELNTEKYSLTTSVFGSSVNSTISLPVRNHTNNTTVECVSRNTVGVVRGKLQETQEGRKQRDLSEGCGNAVLPWTIAGVSLSVTVAILIYLSSNAYIRMQGMNGKPKEEESTYISLDKKDMSQEEYEVIARRPR
ncbi:sialic acid-binding Ig-like lectin 10 [Coregonus clupeaformis]|uniref:sialic acid-binding Ig-like lectin 10 n=1 Tax=Coregonus clupeaformis TaxID=59861 RepID=UPI001BE0CF31|nr:sialic acid-binding Ig-like lectin 10 [Coregonus clupeaformis]